MKMLLIVFREVLAGHVHALLNEFQVTAFTEFHNVSGTGETGPTVQFSLSAGANRMILAAVPEQAAYRLIDGLTTFRMDYVARQGDTLVPLHVFVLPCEQVV
jgi:nitrogen regulatory protein PII